MRHLYVLYIKNHFDKTWHLLIGVSMFRSDLYGWLENNWKQYRNGKVPVVESEYYYAKRVRNNDFK